MFNKGAMFGLFRALKKQSSELFLAKRQSADSQETRDSFKTNRGAMFGLDARIALAIFGALSVISGAALYSAIQQSRVTQLVTSMTEVGKAVESYYLDTVEWLPIDTTSPTNKTITTSKFLSVDSSFAGWDGPYVPYAVSSYALKHNIYNNIHVYLATNSLGECTVGNACYIWVGVNGVPAEIAESVDRDVDDSVGNSGDILIFNYPSIPDTTTITFKYAAMSGY